MYGAFLDCAVWSLCEPFLHEDSLKPGSPLSVLVFNVNSGNSEIRFCLPKTRKYGGLSNLDYIPLSPIPISQWPDRNKSACL